ncbi:hypothetical protein [Campylobacter coli]|uniref:hypothetical protein n=1 Tax=Campylobacter coli TaxID=195 RepID=UPI0037FCBA14
MRAINLSKKIVDKILFLRTSHAFTIFMLSFALFSTIANAVFLSYYIEEENYYTYLVSSFFLINGFLPVSSIHLRAPETEADSVCGFQLVKQKHTKKLDDAYQQATRHDRLQQHQTRIRR